MKTTVEISEDLFARSREVAKREGTTLRNLIEEGLRAALARRELALTNPTSSSRPANDHRQAIKMTVPVQDLEILNPGTGLNEQIGRRHAQTLTARFLSKPSGLRPYRIARGNGLDALLQLKQPLALCVTADSIPELQPNNVTESSPPHRERGINLLPGGRVSAATHRLYPGRRINQQRASHS